MEETDNGKTNFTDTRYNLWALLMSIKNELSELEGVKMAVGDPESKRVTVEWEPPATIEGIKNTLKQMNYPAE